MTAAANLLGLSLSNGWKVTKHLARDPNGSGGTFSQSYEAKNGKRKGFVNAFDFSRAFDPGTDTLETIAILTASYHHEQELLDICRPCSNVVLAIDHGEVQVPNYNTMEGRVFYLLFEMAEGDIRCQMDVTKRFDVSWSMRALKDVCSGLWQVHAKLIAHQDTKPSNVLLFNDGKFKVSDFGRSSRRGRPAHHDAFLIAGDQTYAPPELLYGFVHQEFMPRRMGCDLYMLGNLAAFLFSGVNVTALLFSHLDKQHHYTMWAGTYEEILPYLQAAFTMVLEDLRPTIDEVVQTEIVGVIRQLCDPDLALRGHPRGVGGRDQYSLERYVSTLDRLSKRLDLQLRIERRLA